MNISKKQLFGIVLIVALLTSTFAYAAFHVEYQIPNVTVNIAGIGIEVYNWFEGETLGALCITIDFGLLVPPEKGYSQLIVLASDCNGVDEYVSWDTTLDPSVGTIKLQREVCTDAWAEGAEYEWQPLAPGFVMTDHAKFGFRKPIGSVVEGDPGHIRILLDPLLDATRGEYSFTITFYGDQVV